MNQRDIDASALYGFEAGLRDGADELERARETAVRLEGRIAELERQIAEHVCRIPITHSVRPPLVIDDDE